MGRESILPCTLHSTGEVTGLRHRDLVQTLGRQCSIASAVDGASQENHQIPACVDHLSPSTSKCGGTL